MKKQFHTIQLIFISALYINGQTSIDTVLAYIARNNKTIIANTIYWEAKKLEYQTGLTPYDPKVDYDYLIGSPANAGNQIDFAITQSFDFPTAYARKRKLANEQIKRSKFQLDADRQDVLLTAKLICIELIYLNKLNSELILRKNNTVKWLNAFEKSLEEGYGNIMDVNKAKLQLIEINASLQENLSISNQCNQKLTELNGGKNINFTNKSYAPFSIIPDFETLEKIIATNDPVRQYLEHEKVIGNNEVELAKTLTLPKIESGYRYQAILGQRFNGLHFGLTIPLWENKNIVKTKQAELMMNEAKLLDHMNLHYYNTMQKYEKMSNLKITLDEYKNLFSTLNNAELLDKSLSLGQISAIEFFIEATYYYEAYKKYLNTEMEYYKVVAELNKYQL
ncbi:MAG: TolC family protein [Saprospiraceae bacterium]|jgi:cobalt-zinc-cadmium efflux system outer membrane protein|nr:TolC family protein [Saprospiraceae bacterium]